MCVNGIERLSINWRLAIYSANGRDVARYLLEKSSDGMDGRNGRGMDGGEWMGSDLNSECIREQAIEYLRRGKTETLEPLNTTRGSVGGTEQPRG